MKSSDYLNIREVRNDIDFKEVARKRLLERMEWLEAAVHHLTVTCGLLLLAIVMLGVWVFLRAYPEPKAEPIRPTALVACSGALRVVSARVGCNPVGVAL